MRLILTGGGTGGSVSPLLAVWTELRQRHELDTLFIGTRPGRPERDMVAAYGLRYQPIFSGKLRRYWDWRNISDVFLILLGLFQSLLIVLRFRPDVVVGAGSFVQVPVLWATWALHRPILIHQQDVIPSLANRLCAPIADAITVSLDGSLSFFPKQKTAVTGNPVRPRPPVSDGHALYRRYGLQLGVPLVLVVGGGTGAASLNAVVARTAPALAAVCQILHVTGPDKAGGQPTERYRTVSFLNDDILALMVKAHLVITRAGMSTLAELAMTGAPCIVVPLPDSHQEANADYVASQGGAVVLSTRELTPERLQQAVHVLLHDDQKRADLGKRLYHTMRDGAARQVAARLTELTRHGHQ